jgi:hypothetical protein
VYSGNKKGRSATGSAHSFDSIYIVATCQRVAIYFFRDLVNNSDDLISAIQNNAREFLKNLLY